MHSFMNMDTIYGCVRLAVYVILPLMHPVDTDVTLWLVHRHPLLLEHRDMLKYISYSTLDMSHE